MKTSIWRGSISFGLINIPVTVQSAEQDHDLHFNLLDSRNLSPIKYQKINEKTGKEVEYSNIVKGYAYEKGKYILMSDADFKRANPKATQTIDIEDFVDAEDIDPMYFEKPYYLIPQKGGEKAYALLNAALTKSKKAAVAKVVMHTKEHLTCIFPRGNFLILEIMRFSHALKDPKKAGYLKEVEKFTFKPQELKMAEQLIEGMVSKWDPSQYQDTYYDDLMKHIQMRIKAGKGKTIQNEDNDEEIPSTQPTKNKDLLELLKASLSSSGAKKKNSSHSRTLQ